jgi:glycosyltransferase involved in cell wall biosynthesis
MNTVKGPEIFVEALSKARTDLHGVMIGDGPEANATIDRALRLGVRERLHLVGMVPDASRYLAAFDGLALTSRMEGTPMILLETMWAKVPIIATAVGGVPDLLSRREAVLCAANDVSALAAAMTETVEKPELAAERAAAAFVRIAHDASPETWLDKHEALYRRVIAR